MLRCYNPQIPSLMNNGSNGNSVLQMEIQLLLSGKTQKSINIQPEAQ